MGYSLALLPFSLLLLHIIPLVQATALTTSLAPNERLCFYADVDKAGEKIGVSVQIASSGERVPINIDLYDASSTSPYVSRINPPFFRALTIDPHPQVQSGGEFDVDFEVRDPHDRILLDGTRERQGDYVLTANSVGEYAFCFENDMSTLTEKLVDFDVMVESEPRREAPARQAQLSEHTSALEESVFRLNGMLLNIKRTQK